MKKLVSVMAGRRLKRCYRLRKQKTLRKTKQDVKVSNHADVYWRSLYVERKGRQVEKDPVLKLQEIRSCCDELREEQK